MDNLSVLCVELEEQAKVKEDQKRDEVLNAEARAIERIFRMMSQESTFRMMTAKMSPESAKAMREFSRSYARSYIKPDPDPGFANWDPEPDLGPAQSD